MSTVSLESVAARDRCSSSPCSPYASFIRTHLPSLALTVTLLVTGVIFGLPHLVIPLLLGVDRPYTPFAVSGVSSVTYDKTATYAALANYTSLRLRPPYDTDLWETRDVPAPASTAPFFALAALQTITGGLGNAFIVCDFVLPPLCVLLLYLLLRDITGRGPIALIGSLATILIAFGPTNFLSVPLLLLSQRGSSIVQPLEFSRLLHPELSFTLLAGALLLLWRSLHTGGRVAAVLAGVAGGLLFYTYFYYFPIWFGACALLLVCRRWQTGRVRSAVWLVNVSTWVVSTPFWFSLLLSYASDNFNNRLARHYSETGHVPPLDKVLHTLAYVVLFAIMATIFLKFGRPNELTASRTWKSTIVLFHGCLFLAAMAALNAEVVLGFNLEAMNHYPNRFIQPFLVLAGAALVVRPAADCVSKHPWWSRRTAAILMYGSVATLLGVAALRQTLVSFNVADKHELKAEYRLLFDWLNTHTTLDDVVLASDRDINDLIPVFTHNLLFVPNGERTSTSDAEVQRRFIVGMRLLQRPEGQVHDLLAQDAAHGEPPLGLTYTYFLFVSGNGSQDLRLPEAQLPPILADYRELELARELAGRRLDYIYGRGAERPATVPGWTFRWAYGNQFGNVWEAVRSADGAADGAAGRF
ncbi:MAG: hypothetical protein M3069_16000 [Chloroflexota bacterium]|nr:hypothetical protein [Chloroflexota bacterium]